MSSDLNDRLNSIKKSKKIFGSNEIKKNNGKYQRIS